MLDDFIGKIDDFEKPYFLPDSISQSDIQKAFDDGLISKFHDIYNFLYEELKECFPKKYSEYLTTPVYVYFPWSRELHSILPEEAFTDLRLNRNLPIVSKHEQMQFYNSSLLLAGLSVGNSAALSIVLHGGCKKMSLFDSDIFSLSNLNRVRTGLSNVQELKVQITAREIYSINPYAQIRVHTNSIDEHFLYSELDEHNIDVIVDEIDDFRVKILIRLIAKEYRKPVVMVTDSEDKVILDVERYDLDENYPIFHGIFEDVEIENILKNELKREEYINLGIKFIGRDNISQKMLTSLESANENVSIPQLGTTALAAGAILAKAVRNITGKIDDRSFRSIINL